VSRNARTITYDPLHGSRIRFKANDAPSQRIVTFSRDLKQVTDDWIGNSDGNIEERYAKTKRFIDQVKDVPENNAWRREVLDSRRWFTFVAQEYKLHPDVSVGSWLPCGTRANGDECSPDEVSEGAQMAVTFTTSPFEVIAGNDAGIVIEDRKTGQSWRLSNQQAREFGRLIGRRRRLAEHLAANVSRKVPRAEA
jgi:hypothetical protein